MAATEQTINGMKYINGWYANQPDKSKFICDMSTQIDTILSQSDLDAAIRGNSVKMLTVRNFLDFKHHVLACRTNLPTNDTH
jgi:hypothetical protein